jgi:hypothetical protein
MGVFVPIFCLSFGTIVIGTVDFSVPDGVVSSEFAYRLYWCVPMVLAPTGMALMTLYRSLRVYIALALIVTFGMTLIW